MKTIYTLFAAASVMCAANVYAQTNLWQSTGNIGIGTTSPVDKLDVVGGDWSGLYLRHGATDGWGTLKWSPAGVYGAGRFLILSNETPNNLGTGQDGGLLFRVNQGPGAGYTYPAVAILQNGNVGIGNLSPACKLSIWDSGNPSLEICAGNVPHLWLKNGYGGLAVFDVYNDNTLRIGTQLDSGTQQLVLHPNGNVGIGTSSPGDRLHVNDSVRISTYTTGAAIPYLNSGATLRLANGNIYNPDGAAISRIAFGGMYNPSGNTAVDVFYNYIDWSAGWLTIRNNQDAKIQIGGGMEWGRQDVLLNPTSGNVGIGTTSPTEKLSVKGKIRAQEVIVETTGWSDHVFADSYQLQSLTEVEQHIKAEKHLPGVPSAQEVAEKGVSVGDMQAILLAKIEELTLHQIAQEKQLTAMRSEMDALKAENAALKTLTK